MIPPNPDPRAPIRVVDPVSVAVERVKDLLFRPFDLYRWICIGFTAWLATLLDGGGGGGGGGYDPSRAGNPTGGVRQQWDQAVDYLRDNLGWIIPTVAGVVILLVTIGLALLWLSSRGRFMFLHNVARNRADVVAPWHAYRGHGWSLFLFRLVLGLASLATLLPILAIVGFASVAMIRAEAFLAGPLAIAISACIAAVLVGLATMLLDKFTKDFVVPVMFLRGTGCRAAWGEVYRLVAAHPGNFVVYLLFYLLLSIAVGLATVAVVILTCCVAACFLAIPYVGTVLLLPLFVFFRAYSAAYLAQYGPHFDVFQPGAGMSAFPGLSAPTFPPGDPADTSPPSTPGPSA